MHGPLTSRRLVGAVRLLLTLAAVGIIAYVVDWDRFIEALLDTEASLLVLAYGMFMLDRLLMSYKWGLLLKVQQVRIPLWENWAVYSLASLWSVVLPSTVGADALRVCWLWRRGNEGTAGTVSVVLERLIGFATGLSIAVLALLYLMGRHGRLDLREPLVLVGSVLALMVLGLGLSFNTRVGSAVARAWRRGGSTSRLAGLVERLGSAYLAYRLAPGTMLVFLLLTLGEQLLTLAMGYTIAVAVGIPASALDFCAAFSLALLVSRLPISIDGIGVFEGVLMLLLSLAGVAPAQALALAIIGRFMNVLIFAPGTVVALLFSDFRPGEMHAREV